MDVLGLELLRPSGILSLSVAAGSQNYYYDLDGLGADVRDIYKLVIDDPGGAGAFGYVSFKATAPLVGDLNANLPADGPPAIFFSTANANGYRAEIMLPFNFAPSTTVGGGRVLMPRRLWLQALDATTLPVLSVQVYRTLGSSLRGAFTAAV